VTDIQGLEADKEMGPEGPILYKHGLGSKQAANPWGYSELVLDPYFSFSAPFQAVLAPYFSSFSLQSGQKFASPATNSDSHVQENDRLNIEPRTVSTSIQNISSTRPDLIH
jgi:hypothetical protein